MRSHRDCSWHGRHLTLSRFVTLQREENAAQRWGAQIVWHVRHQKQALPCAPGNGACFNVSQGLAVDYGVRC